MNSDICGKQIVLQDVLKHSVFCKKKHYQQNSDIKQYDSLTCLHLLRCKLQ